VVNTNKVARTGDMAHGRQVVYGCNHIHCISHDDIRGTNTLAAPPGHVCPLSSLHVGLSDQRRQGWWWPRLAVKTIAGDGMLMLQAAGVSAVLEKKGEQ